MNKFKLIQDYGVTAFISTLVIVGSLIIIWRIADKVAPDTLLALVGSWVSAIISAIVVIKSAKGKLKE